MSKVYRSLKKELTQIQDLYETNGVVDWPTFDADRTAHQNKVIEVRQDDFANGTLRVTHPCMIRFVEDVQFNPNRPKTWLDKDRNVTHELRK